MRKIDLPNCPQWLLDADTENEDVVYDSFNRIIWLSGDFLGGNFLGGDFRGGNFLGGNFLGGNFWGDKLTHKPISIYGLTWPILITGKQMQIGCQRHTHVKWKEFSDSEIKNMESRAEEFLRVNKVFLLSICDYAHARN